MYTSLVLVALTGTLVEGDSLAGSSPTWYGDYAIARKQGQQAHKPLAVIVGRGATGQDQISRKGKLSKEALRLLQDRYVCVYLDAKTTSGKRMAREFGMGKGHGLVLSDVSGENQAFYHRGELSAREMQRYLRKYSAPGRIARQTDRRVPPVVRVAAATYPAPARASSGSC